MPSTTQIPLKFIMKMNKVTPKDTSESVEKFSAFVRLLTFMGTPGVTDVEANFLTTTDASTKQALPFSFEVIPAMSTRIQSALADKATQESVVEFIELTHTGKNVSKHWHAKLKQAKISYRGNNTFSCDYYGEVEYETFAEGKTTGRIAWDIVNNKDMS